MTIPFTTARFSKFAGLSMVVVGVAIWLISIQAAPRELAFESQVDFAKEFVLVTNVLIRPGWYGLFVCIHQSPLAIRTTDGAKAGDFPSALNQAVAVNARVRDSVLMQTNVQQLERMSYGRNVACYKLAYLEVREKSRTTIMITNLETTGPLAIVPAEIGLHQSSIRLQNALIGIYLAKFVACAFVICGVTIWLIAVATGRVHRKLTKAGEPD